MLNIAFIDVETTGVDWDKHSIIQIGYVIANFGDGRMIESGSFFIKPYRDEFIVSPDSMKINKIDLRTVFEEGIEPNTVFEHLKGFVDDKKLIFAGWNVWFDYMFIDNMFKVVGLDFGDLFYRSPIDVKSIYMNVTHRGDNLEKATKYLKIRPAITSFHDAEFDALMTYNIWKKLRGRCK